MTLVLTAAGLTKLAFGPVHPGKDRLGVVNRLVVLDQDKRLLQGIDQVRKAHRGPSTVDLGGRRSAAGTKGASRITGGRGAGSRGGRGLKNSDRIRSSARSARIRAIQRIVSYSRQINVSYLKFIRNVK